MREKFPVRYVLLSLLAVIVQALSQTLVSMIGELAYRISGSAVAGNAAAAALYPVFALAGLWALCRFGLRANLQAYRIGRPRLKPFWCVPAVLMPALVCGVYLLLPGRWAAAEGQMSAGMIITSNLLYAGICTGIVEEAVFRGVIMTALERRWGRVAAILVPSVLFGALHIIGNDMDALSMAQLVLAGTMVSVLFSLITYATGSIWNSALMHGVWNCVLLGILHIGPEPDPGAFFNYVPETGNFLLTGGDFGVEASVTAIAVYALFASAAALSLRKNRAVHF